MSATNLPEGVTMEKLLRIYERQKKTLDKRTAYYNTPEGKEYNRKKAAEYYEKNKELVLQKSKERRAKNLKASDPPAST